MSPALVPFPGVSEFSSRAGRSYNQGVTQENSLKFGCLYRCITGVNTHRFQARLQQHMQSIKMVQCNYFRGPEKFDAADIKYEVDGETYNLNPTHASV